MPGSDMGYEVGSGLIQRKAGMNIVESLPFLNLP